MDNTWMVVEDEPDIYDVLLAMFGIWGIEGVAFVDGAEAVAWIEGVDKGRVRGDLPELAIIDIRLPEIEGPEVGKRLRQSPRLKHMAIVLITAYRLTPEQEQEAIATADADLLLYKPLPPMAELQPMLNAVIAKRKAMAAAAVEPGTVPEPVPVRAVPQAPVSPPRNVVKPAGAARPPVLPPRPPNSKPPQS